MNVFLTVAIIILPRITIPIEIRKYYFETNVLITTFLLENIFSKIFGKHFKLMLKNLFCGGSLEK